MTEPRTALVTGGTSGIGLATVKHLLGSGFNVLVNARNESAATDELASLASSFGRQCVFLAGDVREAKTSQALCSEAIGRFGRLDAVVHAAGGPAGGTALSQSEGDWLDAFDVHVHSSFRLFRAAHNGLSRIGGSFVMLSSAAALRGCPGTVAYQTVKAALIQMARALARDHAFENIRVNCVAPGIIRTPFHASMTEAVRQNNLTNRIPLGREGTPEQVASTIAHLIESEFITGETVVIDGGMSMRMV